MQVQASDPAFFERCDWRGSPQCVGDEIVQMRRMAEADGFIEREASQFLSNPRGLGFGFERIGRMQILGINAQRFADNFSGLHGAHVGTGEQYRWGGAQLGETFGDFAGSLDASRR